MAAHASSEHPKHNPQVAGPGLCSSPPGQLSSMTICSHPLHNLLWLLRFQLSVRKKKNPSKHSECCAFSVFQKGLQGSCRKLNKTQGHPCHHPRRMKPEDLACGLVGKKSVRSLNSLYRFLCCFLAGVSSGWQ